MPKRSTTETVAADEGQAFSKAQPGNVKRLVAAEDEMGEFEDAWEDEVESDEEIVEDVEEEKDENSMDVDEPTHVEDEEEDEKTDVFIPGSRQLDADEILVPDESAYIIRHSMKVTWPCLSFDVLRDTLGDERQRFPTSAYVVAGTQADALKNNEVLVYKMSSLHRTQGDGGQSDEDEDEDENLDDDAVIEFRSIPHHGGVNRVRAQPLPSGSSIPPVSEPYYTSTWAETGKVHIWDVRPLIESLDVPGYSYDKKRSHTPSFTISSHGQCEGFAMDWAASGTSSLRLLTGDLNSRIYLTTVSNSSFNALPQPFVSHTSSVEDIQWSPVEPTVFASCSADQTIQVWDVRVKGRKSVAGIEPAHSSDCNVISWNKLTTYLLLSGGDDGHIKVWDLRNVNKKGVIAPAPVPVASFAWHKGPITSVEWHPTEDSVFAASSADDSVSLWDLSVENDEEDVSTNDQSDIQVPPQLLFSHLGQKDVKEIHWHPQIPGTVVSTAVDGFDIFKTISC